MTLDTATIRQYSLEKPGVTASFPFGPTVEILKVGSKMFLSINLDRDPLSINAKCDPTLAEILRAEFAAIEPGYHMNKRHWNTIVLDGSVPAARVLELIDHSYDLVVGNLSRTDRAAIERAAIDCAAAERGGGE